MGASSRAATWFFRVRIAGLLTLLAWIAWHEWSSIQRIRNWVAPIRVAVFPVSATPSTQAFAESLMAQDLEPIADFLSAWAVKSGLGFEPDVRFSVNSSLDGLPPQFEGPATVWANLTYSLKLRWWAFWTLGRVSAPPHDVRVVLVLHPFEKGATLDHSIGLMRGQMAVVNAFADPELLGLLRVVVTHELLHVAGATDKYDAQGRPLYPDGYADPSKPRTVDQRQAALMAGSIPLADGSVRLPRSLQECVVKPQTAREIGWILPNEAP